MLAAGLYSVRLCAVPGTRRRRNRLIRLFRGGGDESVLINCRSGKNYWIVRTSWRPTDRPAKVDLAARQERRSAASRPLGNGGLRRLNDDDEQWRI